MRLLSQKQWRLLYRFFRYLGAAGFLATFLLLTCLIVYYSVTRAHSPNPEIGWTVTLRWTHPTSYGTAQEESCLVSLFWCLFPFGLSIAAGEAIRIYVLERNP
jgi:hypothetical protein